MKFDVVIGNPPYQAPNKKSAMGSKTIWQKFIPLALTHTKDKGYISLIHPQQWRRPDHEILSLFKRNNLLFLKMHSLKEGQKIFGAGTSFDYYILQKDSYAGVTLLQGEDKVETFRDISTMNFIPNKGFEIIEKLTCAQEKVDFFRTMEFHSQKGYKEPKDSTYLRSYYSMEGETLRYKYFDPKKVSQEAMDKHYVPKVIIQLTGHNMKVYNDYDAQLACGHFCIGLRVTSRKEAEQMTAWLKKYWKVLDFAKWGMTREYRVFQMLNRDFYKTEFTTDETLYINAAIK